MRFDITEKYTVQPRDYQGYTIEISVGGTHLDMGITDEELAALSDADFDQKWQDLQTFVRSELADEVRSRLTRAASWSDNPNDLATRVIGGKNGPNPTTNTTATGTRTYRK